MSVPFMWESESRNIPWTDEPDKELYVPNLPEAKKSNPKSLAVFMASQRFPRKDMKKPPNVKLYFKTLLQHHLIKNEIIFILLNNLLRLY